MQNFEIGCVREIFPNTSYPKADFKILGIDFAPKYDSTSRKGTTQPLVKVLDCTDQYT